MKCLLDRTDKGYISKLHVEQKTTESINDCIHCNSVDVRSTVNIKKKIMTIDTQFTSETKQTSYLELNGSSMSSIQKPKTSAHHILLHVRVYAYLHVWFEHSSLEPWSLSLHYSTGYCNRNSICTWLYTDCAS